jgi:hypothetical protein
MACESHTESGSRIEHDSVTLHPQNITTPVHGKMQAFRMHESYHCPYKSTSTTPATFTTPLTQQTLH